MTGGCNINDMIRLRDQIGAMSRGYRTWIEKFLLNQAMTVLANTKRNTPVDTGWLRNQWYIGNIKRVGDMVEVTILNETEYASFVEYGHMNRSRTDWVEGFFMCSLAIEDIRRKIPGKFNREFALWVKSLGADVR